MIVTKFKIGDVVWFASVQRGTEATTCPDCIGERSWLATLPTKETFRISCPTCARGYEGSTGKLHEYGDVRALVEQVTICHIRATTDQEHEAVSYMARETSNGHGSGSRYDEERLSLDKAEAELKAEALATITREADLRGVAARRARSRSGDSVIDRPGSNLAYLRSKIRAAKKDLAKLEEALEFDRREVAK